LTNILPVFSRIPLACTRPKSVNMLIMYRGRGQKLQIQPVESIHQTMQILVSAHAIISNFEPQTFLYIKAKLCKNVHSILAQVQLHKN